MGHHLGANLPDWPEVSVCLGLAGTRVDGAQHGGGDRLRHEGDELPHALECGPAEEDVRGRRGLPPSSLGGLGVVAGDLGADQGPQPADGQLGGLRQHDRLDGARDVRIELGPVALDLLGDRAGAGPVQLAVGQGRPRVRQPVDQCPRHRGQGGRLGAGAVHDHGDLVSEELGQAFREWVRACPAR